MALTSIALKTLINTGNDAMKNLYEVMFSGALFPEDTSNLTIRCSGFTPSFSSQSTYTQSFITAKVERPVTKIDLTRNFSLTFRSDDNWYLYRELLYMHKLTMNASHSYVNSNIDTIKDYLFNVRINRIVSLDDTSESPVERMFNYAGCWIQSITPPDWSTGDSQPISVSCTIGFLEMEDWQSGLSSTEANDSAVNAMDVVSSTNYV